MFLDQFSLLIAIGFSGAALCVTLIGAWTGARGDTFLLSWCVGLAAIVAGVMLFGVSARHYTPLLHMTSYLALIAGAGVLYAGAMQFRVQTADWHLVASATLGALGATAPAFVLGHAGIGAIAGNIAFGSLLVLNARQYWRGRRELPLAMRANAVLYVLTAASFFLCSLVLLAERRWVLTAIPSNWAEDLNLIVAIVGLTGIGGLSLTLNQSRLARFYRMEAMTDSLTGLLNRRGLTERFGRTALGQRSAVIVFDLDHFKDINDRYGHAAGDIVLRRFATVIVANTRATDIASRIGGEEFCVILQNTGRAGALAIAERIRKELQDQQIVTPQCDIGVTVSAGIAITTDKGRQFDALLEEADAALSIAKSTGRNRVFNSNIRLVA